MTGVDWPTGWDRTPSPDREPNKSYKMELRSAIEELQAEMRRLDVDDWRLSTDLDHQSQNPNVPYANQPEPQDPGVVVRWTMDGAQYAVACDRYSRVRDNLRTVGLYIREKRKMEKRPVVTGESEFANARLPPGDDESVAVGRAPPHEVLDVAPDADDATVKNAWRERVKEAHPDAGGSNEGVKRVNRARDEMLGGAGDA